jgi:hypothetical protein
MSRRRTVRPHWPPAVIEPRADQRDRRPPRPAARAIFVFHNLVSSGASGNDWLITDFNSLVDYIATKNIAVVPMGRVVQPRA